MGRDKSRAGQEFIPIGCKADEIIAIGAIAVEKNDKTVGGLTTGRHAPRAIKKSLGHKRALAKQICQR
jgi:hypothetical protein